MNRNGLFGAYKSLNNNWEVKLEPDEREFWSDLNGAHWRTRTVIMHKYIDSYTNYIVEGAHKV